jgi:hypothetical protein
MDRDDGAFFVFGGDAMRFAFAVAAVGAVLLGVGCYVVSLHPLFNENDRIVAQELLGPWYTQNEPAYEFEFLAADDNLYDVFITERETVEAKPGEEPKVRERTAKFEACCGKVGKYNYLDMYPVMSEDDPHANLFSSVQLVGTHAFFRFEVAEDGEGLRLTCMSLDWFITRADEGKPADISFERVSNEPFSHKLDKEDRIILTADTETLKAFVEEHEQDETLFNGGWNLSRTPPAEWAM